jgi:hypothetical protein
MKNRLNWTNKMTIIGLLLIIINFFIIGGGHGYFEPLFFLFPIPCILLNYFYEINLIVIILIFTQFPIYGFILDKNKNQIRKVSLTLLIIHLILGIIALQFIPVGFK